MNVTLEQFAQAHIYRAQIRAYVKREEATMWQNHMEYLIESVMPESSEPMTEERCLRIECEEEIERIETRIKNLQEEIKALEDDLEFAKAALGEIE